jgi:DNA-binding transcriptional regulator/RsmH inhibitor MraZ
MSPKWKAIQLDLDPTQPSSVGGATDRRGRIVIPATLEQLLDARVSSQIVADGPTAHTEVWVTYGKGWSAPWADWLAQLRVRLNDGVVSD